jgi:hypothetical protein
MIRVRGDRRVEYGGGSADVAWTDGKLIGDPRLNEYFEAESRRRRGAIAWQPGGPRVDDWMRDSICFGQLVLAVFEPGVSVTSDGEPLAPPPC